MFQSLLFTLSRRKLKWRGELEDFYCYIYLTQHKSCGQFELPKKMYNSATEILWN